MTTCQLVTYNAEDKAYTYLCPHCFTLVQTLENEVNCTIFRHGAYKENLQQLNPHLIKAECDRLFNENLIYGCGKPYRFIRNNDTYHVEICDYI